MGANRQETVGSYVRRDEVFKFKRDDGSGHRRRWTCSCTARGRWLHRATTNELIDLWNIHCEEVHDASIIYTEPQP